MNSYSKIKDSYREERSISTERKSFKKISNSPLVKYQKKTE